MEKFLFYLSFLLIASSGIFTELTIAPSLIEYKAVFSFLDKICFLTGILAYLGSEETQQLSITKRAFSIIGLYILFAVATRLIVMYVL